MFCFVGIDGTLADNSKRLPFITTEGKPQDWTSYLRPDLVWLDTPIEGSKLGLQRLEELGYDVGFLTSRHEGLRDTTMRWLLEHYNLNVKEERLLMRPDGNLLDANASKREHVIGLLTAMEKGKGILFFENDVSLWPVFSEFGLVVKAPECWKLLMPSDAHQ